MIGRISGILIEKQAPQILVDVQGVGYEIDAPMSTFYNLPDTGQSVTLYTHLVVRDDAHLLFGFASESERRLFRSLIKVSGIGARLALTLLSGISPQEFVALVQAHDTSALVKLPGVGKKTAERLIVEMHDKLDNLGLAQTTGGSALTPVLTDDPVKEAVSALIALGYKPPEASRMVRSIENKASLSSEELIRLALQSAAQ